MASHLPYVSAATIITIIKVVCETYRVEGEKGLSQSSEKKFVPSQRFRGMQVIDVKGSLVGTVKDVGISIGEKDISLIVGAKTGVDVEIPWANVQSIEDVILLNKSVEIPAPAPMVPQPPPPPLMAAPPTLVCPNCKAANPPHAKFCAKCGTKLG